LIEEEKLISKSDKVFEIDCDLDTLICWLQNNPDWSEKVRSNNTKPGLLSKASSRLYKLFYPPQLKMISPGRFCIKARFGFLKPVAFSIVEAENSLEIKAGEPANNITEIGFVSRSNRVKSRLHSTLFCLNSTYRERTRKFSEQNLDAFVSYIERSGLPPARKKKK
jgi:hypothetical protein